MKIPIFEKLVFLSALILTGNGIIGYSIYKGDQKRIETEQWVEHTEKVIVQLGNILTYVKDMEIASRSIAITSNPEFLAGFDQALSGLANFGSLRQLIQDNPTQQLRLDSLHHYIQKYITFSKKTIELQGKQGQIAAIAHISTMQGKQFGDHIRRIITDIQLEEISLLKQRKQKNHQSVATLNRLTVTMFILMSGFTLLLLIITGYYLKQIQEKEKRASELVLINKELDFQHEETEKQEVANKELEAFSYSVSHDLRAPLRHIGGFVDLLVKNSAANLDEKGLRYLNIISESALEMGNLIDALLNFSRLSRAGLDRKKINTNNTVAAVIKTFSDEITEREVKIIVMDLPETKCDEGLIFQVWINLVSNALKYSRQAKEPVIEIGSANVNRDIVFFIKDNGVGFDMKYADKLFGVFQRLHKARDFEGIGIGLANVNRIVVRHGGKCWAESEINKGATFFFSLPNT